MSTLFDLPEPCHTCGRPTESGACTWCAGALTGLIAAERAMRRVSVDPEWSQRAAKWITGRRASAVFTADDLIEAVGLPTGSPNQVGATIRAWAAAGIIRPDGYAKAARKASHGRVLRMWQVAA